MEPAGQGFQGPCTNPTNPWPWLNASHAVHPRYMRCTAPSPVPVPVPCVRRRPRSCGWMRMACASEHCSSALLHVLCSVCCAVLCCAVLRCTALLSVYWTMMMMMMMMQLYYSAKVETLARIAIAAPTSRDGSCWKYN